MKTLIKRFIYYVVDVTSITYIIVLIFFFWHFRNKSNSTFNIFPNPNSQMIQFKLATSPSSSYNNMTPEESLLCLELTSLNKFSFRTCSFSGIVSILFPMAITQTESYTFTSDNSNKVSTLISKLLVCILHMIQLFCILSFRVLILIPLLSSSPWLWQQHI